MSSNKKNIIIRLRVDEATAKADSYFNGNISACIRCATLQYDGKAEPSFANSETAALLSAILRQLDKIGTNVNQTALRLNERMKLSPYGLSASDIQPFVFFRNGLSTIWGHLNQIKELTAKSTGNISLPLRQYDYTAEQAKDFTLHQCTVLSRLIPSDLIHPLRQPRMGSRQAIPLRSRRQPAIRHPTHNVVQLIPVALTGKSTNPTAPHSNSEFNFEKPLCHIRKLV